METDDHPPALHALVAWFSPVFRILGDPLVWPKVMPLDEAVDFAIAGAVVLVDPADERDLAMHENRQRAVQRMAARQWFDRT